VACRVSRAGRAESQSMDSNHPVRGYEPRPCTSTDCEIQACSELRRLITKTSEGSSRVPRARRLLVSTAGFAPASHGLRNRRTDCCTTWTENGHARVEKPRFLFLRSSVELHTHGVRVTGVEPATSRSLVACRASSVGRAWYRRRDLHPRCRLERPADLLAV
jgi:hypothetical protein